MFYLYLFWEVSMGGSSLLQEYLITVTQVGTITPRSCPLQPQSDLLATEQLLWSRVRVKVKGLAQGYLSFSNEGQALLFHLPHPDLSCQSGIELTTFRSLISTKLYFSV